MSSKQIVWLFFGVSGRVSRLVYFLAGLFVAVIQALFLYRMMMAEAAGIEGSAWETGFMLTFFVSLWTNVALGIKRLHDLDRPGILAVALFIPILSIVAFIALCFIPGNPGPNRYGSSTNAPAGG